MSAGDDKDAVGQGGQSGQGGYIWTLAGQSKGIFVCQLKCNLGVTLEYKLQVYNLLQANIHTIITSVIHKKHK